MRSESEGEPFPPGWPSTAPWRQSQASYSLWRRRRPKGPVGASLQSWDSRVDLKLTGSNGSLSYLMCKEFNHKQLLSFTESLFYIYWREYVVFLHSSVKAVNCIDIFLTFHNPQPWDKCRPVMRSAHVHTHVHTHTQVARLDLIMFYFR